MTEPSNYTADWSSPDISLRSWIDRHRGQALAAYKANSHLVEEHGRQEDSFRTGGYSRRQVLELVQNAADAQLRSGQRGRVELLLQDETLYCANEGMPFTEAGLIAVCQAYLSDKRNAEMGRFGLGFKSVLGVSDAPMVLSRSVSFRFDAEFGRLHLRSLAPDAQNFPVLRLPQLVEPAAEFARDPVLAQLSQWAQTIVVLPVVRGHKYLIEDLENFPHEFLLFAPGVSELGISLPDGGRRVFSREEHGEHTTRLVEPSGITTDWYVSRQTHRPSDAALDDVGEATRRPEVTVTYAAPLDESGPLGRFWAYFPLRDRTSARGIHNAPWQVNDDRTNLLPGRFNDELLKVVAELIVEALPHLTSGEDPARHFDYLPARGREAQNFADQRLTEIVPELVRGRTCIPDGDGSLRPVDALNYLNVEVRVEPETFKLWGAATSRPVKWPHWTCYRTPTRRARLRSLIRRDDTAATSLEVSPAKWLESIVPDGTDQQCEDALRVYSSIRDELAQKELTGARIVPDTTGNLESLRRPDKLFLRGNPLSQVAGLRLVRRSFLDRGDVERQLVGLGFKDVDPAKELRLLAGNAANRWSGREWDAFWNLVSEVSARDVEAILLDHLASNAVLKVRCRNTSWQHVGTVVVAGVVDPRDASMIVDSDYHDLHLGVLRSLGVAVRPIVSPVCRTDLTYLEYLRLLRDEFIKALPVRGRPAPSTIDFVENEGPTPLHVLRRFADSKDVASQLVWSRELLELSSATPWTLAHDQIGKYPSRRVQSPEVWAVTRYGLIDTDWGPRPPRQVLHLQLAQWAPLLPVSRWQSASSLPTITQLDDVPVDLWHEFLARTPSGGDHWSLGTLLGEALGKLVGAEPPQTVPGVVGGSNFTSVPPSRLLLAVTDDECRALKDLALPFAAVSEQTAATLIELWGCQPASATLRVEIVPEDPGEPIVLLDRFRRLRDYAAAELDDVMLVRCSSLAETITLPEGTRSRPKRFAVSGRMVYAESSLEDEDLLGLLAGHYDFSLDARGVTRVIADAQSAEIKERIAACRAETDPTRKLLALLPAEKMATGLPAGLLEAVRDVVGDQGELQIPEMLTHVHGDNVLAELRHQLAEAGYPVPITWAGSAPAIAFVRHLGFPSEFAGERNRRLDADTIVLGPPNLNELHLYQQRLAEEVRQLVRRRDTPDRALLFLPTGAGKTRVTVQALVMAVLHDGLAGPILWIAQSEELCEQAIQTWSTVWREFGDRPLRLCRLWSANEVASSEDDVSVVVATDAKLEKCRESGDYEWLQDTAIVIIDEAHRATGTGIGGTLRWLGIDGRRTARPLLGLTATPFKGTGKQANEILASRFRGNLLDVLGEDPYGELQKLGVLSRIEHRVLEGSAYALESDELRTFNKFQEVPRSVLERVGRDNDRTLRLVEDIRGLPEDWPVLVFTSSVLSAQMLSALLRTQGIDSRAVSGTTSVPERRRTIEMFRARQIRVLTNCNLLTQGFDAPAVRALYIARPTFSPNAYIQMVGRGLRGPANGGSNECLVVNIEDTFGTFGEQLAYKEFNYLWKMQAGGMS